MFYLTTHSTHFIYGLNGFRHMVKHHSDSEGMDFKKSIIYGFIGINMVYYYVTGI